MGKGFSVALFAGLAFASSITAQSTCSTYGLLLHGRPTEFVSIGPQGATVGTLSPEEALELELVVTCTNGHFNYASREGRTLIHHPSGCYHVLSFAGGQIHSVDPGCSELLGEMRFDYSEIVRNGQYQLIYRGRLLRSRLPGPYSGVSRPLGPS